MKTGLSARRSTLIAVGGVPAAGVHGVYFLYSERERERGRHTSLALRGMQGGCTWQEVKSKALLVAVVQRLQACTGVSKNVVTCFNYKQQNTRKTVTVVLWSCVHLSADWTHQRAADVSPPVDPQSHNLGLKTQIELVTAATL